VVAVAAGVLRRSLEWIPGVWNLARRRRELAHFKVGKTGEGLVAIRAEIAHADHPAGKGALLQIQHWLVGIADEYAQARAERLDLQMIKRIRGNRHGHVGDGVPGIAGITEFKAAILGIDAGVIAAVSVRADVRLD